MKNRGAVKHHQPQRQQRRYDKHQSGRSKLHKGCFALFCCSRFWNDQLLARANVGVGQAIRITDRLDRGVVTLRDVIQIVARLSIYSLYSVLRLGQIEAREFVLLEGGITDHVRL